MTRVLVTGGAGFIGGHTVRALADAGLRPSVFDDLSTGDRARVAGVPLRVGRLPDASGLREAMEGCSAVVHLAALVSVPQSVRDPALAHAVNVEGTRAVLEAARLADVQAIVFASSSAVYGDAQPPPQREDGPVAPQSPYAASKLAGEELVRAHGEAHGARVVCLRYFNVYGPGQAAGSAYAAVVPRFLAAARSGQPAVLHGGGGQVRDFVHVADVAAANLAAVRSLPAGTYNVGSGTGVTIRDLLALVQAVAGRCPVREEPRREGDVQASVADASRLRAAGWAPRIGLEDGLRSMLQPGEPAGQPVR